MYEAAAEGLKEHDRLLLVRSQMERALSRPLVSTSMIQKALKVSRQGPLHLIGKFNLRELTGKEVSARGVFIRATNRFPVCVFGFAAHRHPSDGAPLLHEPENRPVAAVPGEKSMSLISG